MQLNENITFLADVISVQISKHFKEHNINTRHTNGTTPKANSLYNVLSQKQLKMQHEKN